MIAVVAVAAMGAWMGRAEVELEGGVAGTERRSRGREAWAKFGGVARTR